MDDIDETMTTSTSSTPSNPQDLNPTDEGFEEDNLLYSEDTNRALTPANDHLNAAAPGELSPPRSQLPSATVPESTRPVEPMANGTATRSSARLAKDSSKTGGTSGAGDTAAFPSLASDKDTANQPGGAWKNKKAQEEMQRAWDNIIDKDFSLKEFGDVMLQGKAQMGGQ
ncbi:hypothetical protein H2200_009012 [Cladophialophora chaetospira]|uniref:Uncharacterized protein n=1 Tax=Cladophialophora chaetospira TaxID=386627 RepID=A0AA39CG31_9EURO|nr:hypothetical protein H2200_009012 [Cladophialophora chaetospira]